MNWFVFIYNRYTEKIQGRSTNECKIDNDSEIEESVWRAKRG